MGRFYEAVKLGTGEPAEASKRAIFGKRADAKAQAKTWNGGKIVRAGCGVEVKEHHVEPGKPALLVFLNQLLGNHQDGPNGVPVAKPAPKKKR